jgi:hypothetical protein
MRLRSSQQLDVLRDGRRDVQFQRHATGALWCERVVCLQNINRRHTLHERRVRRSCVWRREAMRLHSSTTTSTNWTFCASEGGTCSFSGTQQVRYGANGAYFYKTLTGGTACTNSVFGDPAVGTVKQCDVGARPRLGAGPATPAPTSTSSYGPQATITCPAGAVDIWPGQYIQGS